MEISVRFPVSSSVHEFPASGAASFGSAIVAMATVIVTIANVVMAANVEKQVQIARNRARACIRIRPEPVVPPYSGGASSPGLVQEARFFDFLPLDIGHMAPSRLYGNSLDFRLNLRKNGGNMRTIPENNLIFPIFSRFFKPRFCENIRAGLPHLFGII